MSQNDNADPMYYDHKIIEGYMSSRSEKISVCFQLLRLEQDHRFRNACNVPNLFYELYLLPAGEHGLSLGIVCVCKLNTRGEVLDQRHQSTFFVYLY